jgi:stage II sporulation protein M
MRYKWWILIAIFLFCASLALGLAIPVDTKGLLSDEISALEELADFLSPLPQASIFILIFLKNVFAVLVSLALSPFFCLMPVLALVVNGGVIGLASNLIIQEKSLGYLLAGLLPHGIFELSAFIMAEAVALSFGTAVMLALFDKERRKLLLPGLKGNSKYLLIALALFLVAAIIETYVTPLFLS